MSKKLPVAPTVFRSLFGGIKVAYEHLGLTAVHSFVWFIMHVPLWWVLQVAYTQALDVLSGGGRDTQIPWGLFVLLSLVFGGLLAAPANAALMYVAKLIDEDEARVRDFFIGLKRYYWRSASVYGFYIVILSFLLANISAAARIMAGGTGPRSWIIIISLVLSANVLLFALLVSNYLFPLIVLQDNSWRKVWKKAMLLTLDNGLVSLLAFILTTILYGISFVSGIFLILFFPAAIGHGHHRLFSALLAKYDDTETAGETSGADLGGGAAT